MTARGHGGRRTQLTGRAALLALVVCALVLALAYPTREYLTQRARINDLRAETERAKERVAALSEQKRRWEDPAYVKAQIREHLHYVEPGELGYIVINPEDGGGKRATAGSAARSDRPWYSKLWGSVADADRATDPPRAPEPSIPPTIADTGGPNGG